ncbi:torsin-1A-interacting protein 2-like isoform X2 [Stegostoma tigrinum]|uniref:torsin-1A-interacting protein 2-like isoform X2 n=1 Tax=Stegostoma tigrinum TaxID=3053191 RepID=UPI00202B39D1|nr:torsin-1A-interacting protein 2-like isoform X2 [Stegostoma tigrinum]
MDHQLEVVSEDKSEQRSQVQEGDETNLQQQAKLDNQSVTENRPEQRSLVLDEDENNLQQKAKLDNQSVTDEEKQGHRPEQQREALEDNEPNLQQQAKLDNQSEADEENQDETCEGMSLSNVQSPRRRQDGQFHQDEKKNQVEIGHRPEQRCRALEDNEPNLQQQAKLNNQSEADEEKQVVLEHEPEQRSQVQDEDENTLQQKAKLDNQSVTGEKCEHTLLSDLQSPTCRQDGQLSDEEEENKIEIGHRPEQKSEALENNERNLQQQAKLDNQSDADEKNQGQRSVFLVAVLLVPIACVMLSFLNHQESEVVENKLNIFLHNFGKVQKSFPNQDEQLWKKSKIMLQKHINMTIHSEPSILMFAAAWNANKTMHCLTGRIAGAYASAFNSRFLEIEGSNKKFLNSDEVKLDLDNQLTSWFGSGRKSAVIHHFQDLPPPSTLLFYKYCDHENAAFKDISLFITVLVDEEKLDPNLNFGLLEERVYDFLVTKFSISSQTRQYNILDIDKFSGLWSRIAHVILPVQPEKDIEENGCKHT